MVPSQSPLAPFHSRLQLQQTSNPLPPSQPAAPPMPLMSFPVPYTFPLLPSYSVASIAPLSAVPTPHPIASVLPELPQPRFTTDGSVPVSYALIPTTFGSTLSTHGAVPISCALGSMMHGTLPLPPPSTPLPPLSVFFPIMDSPSSCALPVLSPNKSSSEVTPLNTSSSVVTLSNTSSGVATPPNKNSCVVTQTNKSSGVVTTSTTNNGVVMPPRTPQATPIFYDVRKILDAGYTLYEGGVYNENGYFICGMLSKRKQPCRVAGKCRFHGKHVPLTADNSINMHVLSTNSPLTPQSPTTSGSSPSSVTHTLATGPPPKQIVKRAWTKNEHYLFLVGLERHGQREWGKIAEMIPAKTITQVQRHADKYVRRLKQKNKKNRSIHDLHLESPNLNHVRVTERAEKAHIPKESSQLEASVNKENMAK